MIPESWDTWGMGRLLAALKKLDVLPEDLVARLFDLANRRKPFGHWRGTMHEESLLKRTVAESEATGNDDREELVRRLLVRDATFAIDVTIDLYFGNYVLGG